MFRFSGSKQRILKYLPAPPRAVQTVVEPFAGSLAYSIHYRPERIVAADANPLVYGLWDWLRQKATPEALTRLERLRPVEKVDARVVAEAHGLCEAEMTLLRLQISGAYVGQLSSWQLWPQHGVDLTKLKDGLPYVRRALRRLTTSYRCPVILEAANETDSMVFLDSPYLDTSANYKAAGASFGRMDPADVHDFARGLRCPVLWTYGDGAAEKFPGFDWKLATVRKVPVLRGGGTRDRHEFYCTLNWPS